MFAQSVRYRECYWLTVRIYEFRTKRTQIIDNNPIAFYGRSQQIKRLKATPIYWFSAKLFLGRLI
jgi:hypothetical protein